MRYMYPDEFSLKNVGGVLGIRDMLERVGEWPLRPHEPRNNVAERRKLSGRTMLKL